MSDFYKNYRKNSDNPVDRTKFSKVLKKYNGFISNKIIYDSFEFNFPHRMGTLRIRKKLIKPKMVGDKLILNHMGVNFKKTLALWDREYLGKTQEELKKIKDKPLVMYNNKHSDGYKFKWYWNKISCNVKNHSIYKFKPVRDNARDLATAIFDGNVNYYK